MTIEDTASTPQRRIRFLSDHELEYLSPPLWLIHHLLPSDTLARLTGPHELIGLLALDWALHVASGRSWHEMACSTSGVAYLTGPDFEHIGARVRSWKLQHHLVGSTRFRASPNLEVLLPKDFGGSSDLQKIRRDLEEAFRADFPDELPALIIIDPLRLPNDAKIQAQHLSTLASLLWKLTHAHVLLLQGSLPAEPAQVEAFEMHLELSPIEATGTVRKWDQPDLRLDLVKKKYQVPLTNKQLKARDLGL